MAKRNDRRIEPTFDGPAKGKAARGLSVSEDDRVVPTQRPRKTARKASGSRSRGKKGSAGRSGLLGRFGRLFYWCFVLAIWGGIAGAGIVVYYGAKMPAATTWSIPDRSPNIKIVSADGRLLANRGMTGGEAVGLHEMSPYIPQAVMAIEDRRFYSHFGIDPDRAGAGDGDECDAWPLHPGRLDADAAAGEEPVPETRPDAGAQGAGSAAGALAGAEAHEGPDPRNVPQPGLFRLGRLWRRGGVEALFRQKSRATYRFPRLLCWRGF